MGLTEYREEIDAIDRQIVELFQQRMRVAGDISRSKQETGAPVLDRDREREKMRQIGELADEDMAQYCKMLYNKILEMSRDYQRRLLDR